MARPRVAALLLACAALACGRTETLEPRRSGTRDASTGERPDAGLAPDGGAARDAGAKPWDAGTCSQSSTWTLEQRPVAAVALAGSAASGEYGPRAGSSVRLEVQVKIQTACEEVSHVSVDVESGDATDLVTLGAFVWVPDVPDCAPSAELPTTLALIPGRESWNPRAVIVDSMPSGIVLTYSLAQCPEPGCPCMPGMPPAAADRWPCASDCDCSAGKVCVTTQNPGGVFWSCQRPCAKQQDCPEGVCWAESALDHVCNDWPACPDPNYCGPGFSCGPGSFFDKCVDDRIAPTSAVCECDAQCPPGHRCIRGLGPKPTCEIPCADDQDCPKGTSFCGSDSVCLVWE